MNLEAVQAYPITMATLTKTEYPNEERKHRELPFAL